ncbi:equilibrative nucleoside transporter 2-like [Periophthalmus magnuspinnatus]|uniref:equilibrative nucleoside transporter 2-like n=1 Tax=Periophthalmus magnuspinnatus TaxID=409849 RepID=UPI002436E197|nr:equilibrative nucleoside transporter 2-like [Periophthalmus magnuspinnatus]
MYKCMLQWRRCTLSVQGPLLSAAHIGCTPNRSAGNFSSSSVAVFQDDQHLYSINCTTPLLHNVSQHTCMISTPFSSKEATYEQLQPLSLSIPIVITALLITALVTAFVLLNYKCKENIGTPVSDSKLNPSQSVSQDTLHAGKFICGLLGLLSAFPRHFFLISSLYLHREMAQNWIFSLIVLVTQVAGLIFAVVKTFLVQRFSAQKHTWGCLVVIVLIFVTMLISINQPMAEEIFLVINMCALWLATWFCCMIEYNLSVEVTLLSTHSQSFALGLSCSGILASVVMIISVAVREDAAAIANCCHSLAILVSLAALITYTVFQCLLNRKHQTKGEAKDEQLPLKDQINNNDTKQPPQSPDANSTNWTRHVCTFYVALVPMLTCSVYPAVTADVQTASSGIWARLFMLVCCFTIFNICDCICEWIGPKLLMISQADKHFLIVFPVLLIIHTGFIPVFIFWNAHPRAHQSNNAVFPGIMIFFSFCHGFLSHLSVLYKQESHSGPDISKDLWWAIGGTIGAVLSFAFRAIT